MNSESDKAKLLKTRSKTSEENSSNVLNLEETRRTFWTQTDSRTACETTESMAKENQRLAIIRAELEHSSIKLDARIKFYEESIKSQNSEVERLNEEIKLCLPKEFNVQLDDLRLQKVIEESKLFCIGSQRTSCLARHDTLKEDLAVLEKQERKSTTDAEVAIKVHSSRIAYHYEEIREINKIFKARLLLGSDIWLRELTQLIISTTPTYNGLGEEVLSQLITCVMNAALATENELQLNTYLQILDPIGIRLDKLFSYTDIANVPVLEIITCLSFLRGMAMTKWPSRLSRNTSQWTMSYCRLFDTLYPWLYQHHLYNPVIIQSLLEYFLEVSKPVLQESNPAQTTKFDLLNLNIFRLYSSKNFNSCDDEDYPYYDCWHHLLKFYCDSIHDLEATLNPPTMSRSPSHNFSLDWSSSWHLSNLLCSLGHRLPVNDKLCLEWAAQLERAGQWQWAAFVVMHMADPRVRKQMLRAPILRHVVGTRALSAEERFLVEKLAVPERYVSEAKAVLCKNSGALEEEAHHWLMAGHLDRSYRLYVDEIEKKNRNIRALFGKDEGRITPYHGRRSVVHDYGTKKHSQPSMATCAREANYPVILRDLHTPSIAATSDKMSTQNRANSAQPSRSNSAACSRKQFDTHKKNKTQTDVLPDLRCHWHEPTTRHIQRKLCSMMMNRDPINNLFTTMPACDAL